jgi:hypothetical protein
MHVIGISVGEVVVLGAPQTPIGSIRVVAIQGDRVRLIFDFPRVPVHSAEVAKESSMRPDGVQNCPWYSLAAEALAPSPTGQADSGTQDPAPNSKSEEADLAANCSSMTDSKAVSDLWDAVIELNQAVVELNRALMHQGMVIEELKKRSGSRWVWRVLVVLGVAVVVWKSAHWGA